MLGSPILSMPSLSSCTSSRPSLFLSRRSNNSTSLFSSALGGSEAGLSSPLVAFPCICHSRGSKSPAPSRDNAQQSKGQSSRQPDIKIRVLRRLLGTVLYGFTVLETRLGIRVRQRIVSTMFQKCAHYLLVQGTSSILVGRMSVCTAGRLAQTSQPTFHAKANVFNHNTEHKAKYVASYTGPRLRQKTHRYTAAHNSDQ